MRDASVIQSGAVMVERSPRVLLVGPYPPPHGGIATHLSNLRDGLPERGIDVAVLDVGGKGALEVGVTRAEGYLGFAYHLAALAAKRFQTHTHISGHNSKSWWLALSCGQLRSARAAPPLLTVHSGLMPAYLAAERGRRVMAAQAVKPFGKLIAVNAVVADALLQLGAPSSKIEVLPAFSHHSVRPGVSPPELVSFREARRPLLAAALAPSPIYGAQSLFEAMRRLRGELPELGLVVFGPGTDLPSCRAQAAQAEVSARTLFLGELPHASALAVIRESDVFVRPTLADGDSVSVREALSLGRPTVASDVGSRPKGCLLFQAGDAPEMCEQIRRALGQGPAPVEEAPDAVARLAVIYRELSEGKC